MNQYPTPDVSRRQFLKGALIAGVAGAFGVGCSSDELTPPPPDVDDCSTAEVHIDQQPFPSDGVSLTQQPWNMPGVAQQPNGLHVEPRPITIVDKDNKKDVRTLQFWPDRRFDAEALVVSGGLRLDSPAATASFLLAAELPTTYDEFQFPGKGVRVTIAEQRCVVEAWDGVHQNPTTTAIDLNKPGLAKSIEAVKKDGRLTITVDGKAVTVLDGFIERQSWLGLEATDGGYTVDHLQVTSPDKDATIADMTTLRVEQLGRGLRDLNAQKAKTTIGAAMALKPLLSDQRYAALAVNNYSSLTTENSLKPEFVHPNRDVYCFEETDRLAAIAKRHGMQVHGHALLPNRSLPKWMRDMPTASPDDKLRVQSMMANHLSTIVSRFPDFVSFDVVNEPLDGNNWRNDTLWYKAMGDQFINSAFRTVFQANPRPVYFFNHYSMDKAARGDEEKFQIVLRKMVAVQQENPGIRLGIGFEGHVYETPRDNMSPEDLKRRIEEAYSHGIFSRVSEMDVTTHYDGSKDTTDRGLELQAQQFGSIARVALHTAGCISYTMWGIGGKYVSTAGISDSGELTYGSNLPWDKDLKQRSRTYRALQEAMRAA